MPTGQKEGDDLPCVAVPDDAARNKSLNAPTSMRTRTIPGKTLAKKNNLAITLSKIAIQHPELKELRLVYDPITIETGAQKIGVIDCSNPRKPSIDLIPTEGMRSTSLIPYPYKGGDASSTFSKEFGASEFICVFVNQRMTDAYLKDAELSGCINSAQDRHKYPFTDDYNFVFLSREPGVLEIEIKNA